MLICDLASVIPKSKNSGDFAWMTDADGVTVPTYRAFSSGKQIFQSLSQSYLKSSSERLILHVIQNQLNEKLVALDSESCTATDHPV